jgi:hypothetical protein
MNVKLNTNRSESNGCNLNLRKTARFTKATTSVVHAHYVKQLQPVGFAVAANGTTTHSLQTILFQGTQRACSFQRTVHATADEVTETTGCSK